MINKIKNYFNKNIESEVVELQISIEQLMKITLVMSSFTDEIKLRNEITKIMFSDLNIEQNAVNKMLENVNLILNKEHDLIQRFIQDDVEYGFIPNLSKITAGEFIDLDNYMNSEPKQLHKICSILYRPVTKSYQTLYEIEPYTGTDKLSDIMLKVDCKVILGATLFFYNLSNSLLSLTNTYIQKQAEKVIKRK